MALTPFMMSAIKRTRYRFRGNKVPAINRPFSGIIQTDRQTKNNLEKKVDNCAGKCGEASEENKANCVFAYCRTKASGPKSKGPAASSTEPQLETKCYSKDGSNPRMHKRARVVREEQLHGDSSIKAGKGWVSVPLDVFNHKSETETVTEIVEKGLHEAHATAKKVVRDLEQTISKRRENKLQKLQMERLRVEITQESQKYSKLIEEKLAIKHDIDALRKNFSSKVEKELDSYRLKMDREHAEIVATLTTELGREKEKNRCHICFTSSRDAIVLPCLHFQCCTECLREHQRRQTECPTCRAKINGVIHCDFFAS